LEQALLRQQPIDVLLDLAHRAAPPIAGRSAS
jgi:hypothetical protein